MEIKRTINIKNEEETKEFGLKIGQEAVPGQVIGLIGDLGTGKTTLTKYIARGLGVEENISSPTFMIVREYHGGRMPLYHVDDYRSGDPEELLDIGADEYFDGDGLCVVEWADMVMPQLPEDSMFICIEYGASEGERTYKCTF